MTPGDSASGASAPKPVSGHGSWLTKDYQWSCPTMQRKRLSDPFMSSDPERLVLPRWFHVTLGRFMVGVLKRRRIYDRQPFLLGADFRDFKSWREHIGRWSDGAPRLAIDDLVHHFLSDFIMHYGTLQRIRTTEDPDHADRYIARCAMNFIHQLQRKADRLGALVYSGASRARTRVAPIHSYPNRGGDRYTGVCPSTQPAEVGLLLADSVFRTTRSRSSPLFGRYSRPSPTPRSSYNRVAVACRGASDSEACL